MNRVLGLTGASGYIGQAVLRIAVTSGWTIVAIGRRPVEGAAAWRQADLNSNPSDDLIDGLDAVLHLAANTDNGNTSPASELAFATALATRCAAKGTPLVFVSSQASAADAPSDYGRTKFAIERAITPSGAVSVRPGLVIGGREGGLFGLLVTLVRKSPLLPVLLPRPSVQPIHVDDLAKILLLACTRRDLAGRILCAAGESVSFDTLLAAIARHRLRLRRRRLPVPLVLLRTVLLVLRPILGPRLSPSRLDSLTRLRPLDAHSDLVELGVVLRPLSSALDRRGRGTRAMLLEAYALARALTGRTPPASLMRRYMRLLHTAGQRDALPLPAALLDRPAWLASIDMPAKNKHAPLTGGLAWRMGVVARLAETEPTLADLFLVTQDRSGMLAASKDIAKASLCELHSRCIGPLARRLAKGLL